MLISMNTVLYHKEKERSGAVTHGFSLSLSLSHTHTPLLPWHTSSGMPRALSYVASHINSYTHSLTLSYFHGTHTHSLSSTSMVYTCTHTLTLSYTSMVHTHTHTHSSTSMVHTYTLSLLLPWCTHAHTHTLTLSYTSMAHTHTLSSTSMVYTHTRTHTHALPWYCYLPDLQVQECPELCQSLPGLWHLCCSRVCATGPTVLFHHSGLLG